DCPPGWFEHWNQIIYQYEVNGVVYVCKVWVNFCCRWNPELQRPEIILKNVYVDRDYRNCLFFIYSDQLRWYNFLSFLYQQVEAITQSDPNCYPQCPPCGESEKIFSVIKASNCIKWVSKPAIVTNDGHIIEWAWGIEYCDTSNYCLYTYSCCTDWEKSPPETHIELISVEEYGAPACPTTTPEVPPPGKTWEEPWETECFANPCQKR
ncbi:MAG: hypothetical protein ACK42G_00525, partial [Candidatus Kapaibacteriota bacterium]